MAKIAGLGGAMIAMALVMALGGIGGAYFASHAAISFGADLRLDLFQKVQKFSFQNIDAFSTGSLVTRLTNDITQVQNIIMMILRTCLRAPGMLLGALIMAFMMNAGLAVIILIVIPLLGLAIFFLMRVAFPRFEIMQRNWTVSILGFRKLLSMSELSNRLSEGNTRRKRSENSMKICAAAVFTR